jgi:hypothetical protein
VRLRDPEYVRTASGRDLTAPGLARGQRRHLRRTEYDTLKATVHNALRTGGQAQNRHDRSDFRSHLGGRIAWVEHVHPAHGARLRADFERIHWG